MREIKFRAWDTRKAIMLPSSGDEEIFIALGGGSYLQHGESLLLPLQDGYYKVMQFAGLRDANGVEIYEGDIVGFSYGIPPVGVNAEVAFLDGCYYALTPNHNPKRCNLRKLSEYVGEYDVRGNIHENPELLEVRQ